MKEGWTIIYKAFRLLKRERGRWKGATRPVDEEREGVNDKQCG